MTAESASAARPIVFLPMLRSPRDATGLQISPSERATAAAPFPGGFSNLPVELFRTARGYYVFDARHVSFFQVDRVAWDVLAILRERDASEAEVAAALPMHAASEILQAWDEIAALQTEGRLSRYQFERRPRHTHDEVTEVLSHKMGGFTIFVTTQCNLGCSYCIYGGQYEQHDELSQQRMEWETLRRTMDFLREHSTESQEIRLDFFGGEPLMAFDLIERGVRYLKDKLPATGPIVRVTVTSNGTVLTERILDFLIEHDVYVQFSIDGGAESHDARRPFKGGRHGSHAAILHNLQRIHDRNPTFYRTHMRMKGVLTTAALDIDDSAFFEHSLVRMIVQDGHFTFLNEEPHWDVTKDDDYFARVDKLRERLVALRDVTTEAELVERLPRKYRALYGHTFGLFFDAQTVHMRYFRGRDATPFTKGCLTGYQEGAVSASGDISICLKSAKGDNFVIGNVHEGRWYFDKIRALGETFHRDWSGCRSCFVQKMCDLCYEKLDGEPGHWTDGRSRFCEFNRTRFRRYFETMLEVVEHNPALWRDLEVQLTSAAAAPEADPVAERASSSLYSRTDEEVAVTTTKEEPCRKTESHPA